MQDRRTRDIIFVAFPSKLKQAERIFCYRESEEGENFSSISPLLRLFRTRAFLTGDRKVGKKKKKKNGTPPLY